MEKKRWVFIFSALCLALALTSSPVEAQGQCLPCGSCDQDGDGEIRPSRGCINKCVSGDIQIDVDDTDGDPNMCTAADAPNLYRVTLTGGDWAGGPATWEDKTSGDGWLGLPVHNPGEMMIDLSFFQDAIEGGDVCFPVEGPIKLNGAQLIVKKFKGGGDFLQAMGLFYFVGKSDDAQIDINYKLEVFGLILEPASWPGTQEVSVPDYVLSVNTTTKGGRKIACTSEGTFIAFMDVVEIQPVP